MSKSYLNFINKLKRFYKFKYFDEKINNHNNIILRHDVDYDLDYALNLAKLNSKLRIKSRLVVRLKDVHYYAHVDSFVEEMTDKDKILYDGRLYSREKFEKINENFTKIMQRKACTKLLMNILGSASYSNHNNLYKELLISLNLPTNG